jgi:hypothetical protein
VIERLAYRFGIVPRALRNAAWIVVLSCAVATVCVLVNSSQYSVLILVFLLAFPFRMRPSMRAWLSQSGTEWMLATGAWTRAMLARSTVFEILVLAGSGASALAVIAWAHAIDTPQGLGRSFIFFASAVLSFQSFTAVIANWNSSTRLPARAHLPHIRNQEIASPLRIVFLVTWIVAVQSLAAAKGRPLWVVPAGALLLIATYWLVSGAEPVAKTEGRERAEKTRGSVSVRPFDVCRGLLWEGSRPLARYFIVLTPALCLVNPLGRAFGWHADAYTLHLLNMGALSWVAGSPFRWESKGGQSEFLCTSGVRLRDARRIELLAGLFVCLEMLVVGWLINLPDSIPAQGSVMYAIAVGVVLLVCNKTRLPSPFGPAMRVFRLLSWGLIVAVLLTVALAIALVVTAREPKEMFPTCVGVLLVIGFLAPIALWIWAFLRAAGDDQLRQEELEPKLYLVLRP